MKVQDAINQNHPRAKALVEIECILVENFDRWDSDLADQVLYLLEVDERYAGADFIADPHQLTIEIVEEALRIQEGARQAVACARTTLYQQIAERLPS